MLGSLGGYTVGRSLRFRSSASAYLSRTPASAGNRTTWTWSAWVKRGILGTSNQSLFSADTNSGAGNSSSYIWFTSSDTLAISIAAGTYYLNSSSVYRDPSAWYHIVVAYDTTQATASNRLKLYVNGVQLTAFGTATYPTQNYTSNINNNVLHSLSARVYQSPTIDTYTDCYLAEVNFIDGQALTPSSFGAYDTNGVWQPKKYSGTYGTNGFYLPFSNTTSTTTLVQDSSGNGNNWTPNNISLTAGTTYDSMIDSPTVSASASNYATLNPLDSAGGVISDGNLSATQTATGRKKSTIGVSSGKWYWEVTAKSSGDLMIGASSVTLSAAGAIVGSAANDYGYYSTNGQKYTNGTSSAYGATYTTNDVIGVALDLNSGTITFYKNNTSQGTAFTGVSGTLTPAVSSGGAAGASFAINFGQQPFSYTPPTGYSALNTYNLPAPSIANGAQYMNAVLWSGNSTANRNITGVGFAPDFVWLKCRNSTQHHHFVDSVRGTGTSVMKTVFSSLTNAEETDRSASILRYGNINALISDGFTVNSGTDATYPYDQVNANGLTYVAWNWKANGSGVTNTSGTITSTVSANPTAGFSVVTYTGTGSAGTIGHGLGVAPSMIIVKRRSTTGNWPVYHTSLGNATSPFLNLTNAANSQPNLWNSTTPTSSVFTVGSDTETNQSSQTLVAYCFAAVSGYSAFGSYTGNGSTDGTFVYTGFRPRWVMMKRSSDTGYWAIKDSSRNGYNQTDPLLYANIFDAEYSAAQAIDILSNGFKLRSTGLDTNGSGSTYIYAAFAENPLKFSRAR